MAAFQAPLSLGFSRQEYWSGVPLPSPEQQCNVFQMPALCPITAYNQLVIGKRKKKKKNCFIFLDHNQLHCEWFGNSA